MREIVFYQLDGTVKKEAALTEENLALCHGMKLKCHLKNGNEVVGFADVYKAHNKSVFDGKIHDYIYLWTFNNLAEEQHKLVGTKDNRYNQTFCRVNIDDIITIEAILYSNPRWGTRLTNQFPFM